MNADMVDLRRHEQVTIVEYLQSHKELVIERWANWRNEQFDSDERKALVDEVFTEYINTLDKLLGTLVPF